MAIKKRERTSDIVYEPEEELPFAIVAKPKKPLPAPSLLESMYGKFVTPKITRRFGLLAVQACGSVIDAGFTIRDLVHFIRTPRNPKIPTELRYRGRVKNRGTAITAYCVDCQGFKRKNVSQCVASDCPLWAFRFGNDPFWGKSKK